MIKLSGWRRIQSGIRKSNRSQIADHSRSKTDSSSSSPNIISQYASTVKPNKPLFARSVLLQAVGEVQIHQIPPHLIDVAISVWCNKHFRSETDARLIGNWYFLKWL